MKIMKKQSIYALMSAIALAGAIGFSSCSSSKDDEVIADNPGYNAKTGEVPVQFLFNVSSRTGKANSRQTAAATQADENITASLFRGIEDSHVLCFTKGHPNATNGNYLTTTATAMKDFNMARVATAKSLGSDGSTTRVLEMTLPLATNSMAFYGRAIVDDDYDSYGHLDEYNVGANLANVSFKLGRRLNAAQETEFHNIQKLLAAVLTCVMNVKRGTAAVSADGKPGNNITPYGFDIPVDYRTSSLTWASYGAKFEIYQNYYRTNSHYPESAAECPSPVESDRPLTELEIKLGRAYFELTTIKDGELRNGSAPALISTAKDLWSIVNAVRCANPTSFAEAVAKYMAALIFSELERYFTPQFDATALTQGGGPNSVEMKEKSENLVTTLLADTNWPTEAVKPTAGELNSISTTDLSTFPANFNVPQGSCYLAFDSEKKSYSYVQNYNSTAVGGKPFTVADYYYPAELLYFGNSPVRVSEKEHKPAEYPQTTTNWNKETSAASNDPWYGWKWGVDDGEVTSKTRSVAMRNDINYGSALLAMTVGYTNDEYLEDNNTAIQSHDYGTTEDPIKITPNASTFQLVGIVISGQYPRVGWNYLPALADGERVGYVYDKVIAGNGAIPSTKTNYTLVFDNYNAAPQAPQTGQDIVYVALELKNTSGVDFFGVNNMISKGSNFYLIGALDPAEKSGPALPDYHALPPYGMSGTTTVPRVFIQDHKTMVNFKIGKNSLKSAYLTVPDLRSSSVTLGLSVDMSWSNGLNFGDIELGGTGN